MTSNNNTFFKLAFLHGGLAGLLVIGMMISSYTIFGMKSSASGMVAGFALMFFFLSLIYFGIRRYRDKEQGGVIRFSKSFLLGLAMSAFAGLSYIIGWEIYLALTQSEFISVYTDHLVELEREKGVKGEELQAFIDKVETMKGRYANPFYRIPITFTEIFPVALFVTLISSLILHRPKFWARKV